MGVIGWLSVPLACAALLFPLACTNGCEPPRYQPNRRSATGAPHTAPHAPFVAEEPGGER